MIKLDRTPAPTELTTEEVKILTNKYKNNGEEVWKKPCIKKALLAMSNKKCCYCEIKLGEEGKYMHVEHFHCKSKYPEEVVDWENLLPSCNRCNVQKSNHDTYLDPIINPCIDNPPDFLYMENYRLKSKKNNPLGNKTIDVLYLNDSEHLTYPRFKIGNEVQEKLQILEELIIEYVNNDNKSIQRRNKIINNLKDILKLSQPDQEYSATIATVIIQDNTYQKIKQQLSDNNLWDEELLQLHNNALRHALLL